MSRYLNARIRIVRRLGPLPGLTKKLTNGTNKAIETDSAKELKIDRKNTILISLFLRLSRCELIFFNKLNVDILLFSI